MSVASIDTRIGRRCVTFVKLRELAGGRPAHADHLALEGPARKGVDGDACARPDVNFAEVGLLDICVDPDVIRRVIHRDARARCHIFADIDKGPINDAVELGRDRAVREVDFLQAAVGLDAGTSGKNGRSLGLQHIHLLAVGLDDRQAGARAFDFRESSTLLLGGGVQCRLGLVEGLLRRDVLLGKLDRPLVTGPGVRQYGERCLMVCICGSYPGQGRVPPGRDLLFEQHLACPKLGQLRIGCGKSRQDGIELRLRRCAVDCGDKIAFCDSVPHQNRHRRHPSGDLAGYGDDLGRDPGIVDMHLGEPRG